MAVEFDCSSFQTPSLDYRSNKKPAEAGHLIARESLVAFRLDAVEPDLFSLGS
ncbi:TPA: hypothetical protein MD648_002950 [Citrobacter freundii]|uniref:hypothetical protein n=1 Tax=Citrobacter freundii TaxID=546 RepID=UPI00198B2930|nr:hypothetical protein [Salmonella enterica]HBU6168744.1 hypothetical protein [Citrobacter freundii]HBV8020877.1 hypothetical protein [Citrobacter freundii]